ncbi:Hexose carrier protein HEX6 [Glycine max]|nr:Hexose carrier protein HEX6 [Glycine max]
MAVGLAIANEGRGYSGKITSIVILSCMVAATGGIIFGYDIGISGIIAGGVTSMVPFLEKFFPDVYTKMKQDTKVSNYCKFDSQLLTAFTSSLYIAGLIASFFASSVTRAFGRKPSILIGGAAFLIGAALGGAALNIYMLILGRVMLGVGIGFANQSAPLYLSEMAPPRYRGAINTGFQLCVGIGVLSANLVNFGTEKIKAGWGWRISLVMAAVPASMLTFGSLFLPETPNSIIQHDKNHQKAKLMLQRIRGTDDVQQELEDLIEASEMSNSIKHPFKNILHRKYRPQLVMAIAIPFFQQFTGINVISFYAPILFLTIGLGESASLLLSAVVTGFVGTASTFISMLMVDRLGRRVLFISGGIQMFFSQVLIGSIMATQLGDHGEIDKKYAYLILVLICIYVAGFAWSWGPLGWLVPSEIFQLEIRSAAQSITVAVNFFFTFIVAQTFLIMLCHFKFGTFFFFGGWVVVMTAFVYLLLPETRNVPIEQMDRKRLMAVGLAITSESGQNNGKITLYVVLSCMMAAMGGVIFGYDIGITGGVTSMEPFLKKFFHKVYLKMKLADDKVSNYCVFDSQLLTSFTSSLYVAGLVTSFFASYITKAFGRKPSIVVGGAAFLAGTGLGGAAFNVYMLIVGRLLLGVGVGFANQAVPLYLSEMALPRLRGAINNGFQLSIGIGALSANLINYGTEKIEGGWGWRMSLAMAAVPASVLTLGALFLPETPNSVIQRSHDKQKAKLMLQRIRGMEDVQAELDDLIKASSPSKTNNKQSLKLILKGRYRPQLVMALAIPFFQQVTGINVIAFYAPLLFRTIGLGESASLLSAVMTGVVGTGSTFISMFVVDKLGRRTLFMIGGIQMFVSQCIVGGIMALHLKDHGGLSKGYAFVVLVMICIYVAGFGWSWGPLGWLVPSEIFPLEIRSAGQSITVAVSFIFTFIVAQTFLSMLCHFRSGIFFFFGGWVVVMTTFVYYFLPETKSVPLEQMEKVWQEHWFWKRIVGEVSDRQHKGEI